MVQAAVAGGCCCRRPWGRSESDRGWVEIPQPRLQLLAEHLLCARLFEAFGGLAGGEAQWVAHLSSTCQALAPLYRLRDMPHFTGVPTHGLRTLPQALLRIPSHGVLPTLERTASIPRAARQTKPLGDTGTEISLLGRGHPPLAPAASILVKTDLKDKELKYVCVRGGGLGGRGRARRGGEGHRSPGGG